MIDHEDREYWVEEQVPWGELVYPEDDSSEDSLSSDDKEESGSEFVLSNSEWPIIAQSIAENSLNTLERSSNH